MKMQRSLHDLIVQATSAQPGDGSQAPALCRAWNAQKTLRNIANAAEVVDDCLGAVQDAKQSLKNLEDALQVSEQDRLDARRFRAFINSTRIKFFGWAGFEEKDPNGNSPGNYRHFGGEFWSMHDTPMTEEQRAAKVSLLTRYADATIAHLVETGKSHVL